jgi:hypothetical protein
LIPVTPRVVTNSSNRSCHVYTVSQIVRRIVGGEDFVCIVAEIPTEDVVGESIAIGVD